ncbi:transmembrane matrix receptor MUP-4-like [Saccostrea echinata]|uniref:transmembrane matrix receptor MUP-4-like n=1 Tax=Saccostrea echinata TaxID=191078 RepID=UPI002A813E71|nr:transmembrane matrix receptor MUP-4-like [Saccostrea echinata]
MIYFLILGFLCLRANGFLMDSISNILTNPMGTPNPLLHCNLKPADIVFLLDSSGSEGARHFREQLNFVKNFVNEFDIGPSNVQISVVSFATRVRENFNLKRYHTKADLLNAIDKIPYMSGSTHTADAITYAIQHSFTPIAGDRAPVTDVMFVVTDGQSISPTATKQAANLVHKAGVKTFAIGVGNSISKQELLNIASDPQHVFHVSSFDALHLLQSELRNKTCEALSYSSLYCSNHITNCGSYGHSVCITYAQWGRDKCPLYCGYCQAQGTPTPMAPVTTTQGTDPFISNTPALITQGICMDQISNCHDYGLSVCSTYRQWADTNCPRYCAFCKAPSTPPPPVTTTVIPTPPPLVAGPCEDKMPTCKDYLARDSNTCNRYLDWSTFNCRKTCGICHDTFSSPPPLSATTTSTSAPSTTLHYDICEDVVHSCESYGPSICFNYKDWAAKKCAKFCLFCEETTTTTTTTTTTPAPTTEPPCVNVDPDCEDRGPVVCFQNQTWAQANCRVFCAFCTRKPVNFLTCFNTAY